MPTFRIKEAASLLGISTDTLYRCRFLKSRARMSEALCPHRELLIW